MAPVLAPPGGMRRALPLLGEALHVGRIDQTHVVRPPPRTKLAGIDELSDPLGRQAQPTRRFGGAKLPVGHAEILLRGLDLDPSLPVGLITVKWLSFEHITQGAALRVTINPDERAIIEATLAFANLKRIRSPHDVQRIFERLAKRNWVGSVSAKTFLEGQNELREHLGNIARKGHAAWPDVQPYVEEMFGRDPGPVVRMRPTFQRGELSYLSELTGVEAVVALGLALILSKKRGLAPRVNQCGYCGRFRLDVTGRPRTYCSDAHRLAYDRMMAAERMRNWRLRKRKTQEQH